jgi:hypothetical protein
VTGRVQQFRRIVGLRKAQERVCEALLAQANGRVAVLDLRVVREKEERMRVLVEGREALVVGEREPWRLAEGSEALAAQRMVALMSEREAAVVEAAEARVRCDAARMRSEQVGLLLERAVQEQREEQERRWQRESDDRFAARMLRMRGDLLRDA